VLFPPVKLDFGRRLAHAASALVNAGSLEKPPPLGPPEGTLPALPPGKPPLPPPGKPPVPVGPLGRVTPWLFKQDSYAASEAVPDVVLEDDLDEADELLQALATMATQVSTTRVEAAVLRGGLIERRDRRVTAGGGTEPGWKPDIRDCSRPVAGFLSVGRRFQLSASSGAIVVRRSALGQLILRKPPGSTASISKCQSGGFWL
jgi:hypothetical protein